MVAYLMENGQKERAHRMLEEAATEMREISAPASALGSALYNLACGRVDQDRNDEALELLGQAFPLRPDLRQPAKQDPDLAALRDNPAFATLVNG